MNPSPYGFMINLGNEHLIGASPEMFVRVEGRRVETCPISGTIKRGGNALEDAERIRELLNSYKDEAELTMCTDVDRNDKSRICIPGSVQVIGRRQIEMYSHLIHTVDHVEGILADGYDALDAFMTHMWAVTVTGAPKRAAVQWVEDHEESNRLWYGGAVGVIGFDGRMNTGLTLRTIRLEKRRGRGQGGRYPALRLHSGRGRRRNESQSGSDVKSLGGRKAGRRRIAGADPAEKRPRENRRRFCSSITRILLCIRLPAISAGQAAGLRPCAITWPGKRWGKKGMIWRYFRRGRAGRKTSG
jgi:hypothetical protein